MDNYDDTIVPHRPEQNNDETFYSSIPEHIFERNNKQIEHLKRKRMMEKVLAFYNSQCSEFMKSPPKSEHDIMSVLLSKYSSCYEKIDNPTLNNYISCLVESMEKKKVVELPKPVTENIVLVFMRS